MINLSTFFVFQCRTSSNATSVSSGGRGDVDEDDHEYDYPVDSLAALKLSAAAAAVNGKHGQNNTKTYLNSRNNNGIGQTRKPWTVDLLSSSVFLPIEHCLSISTALLSADLFKATNDAKQNCAHSLTSFSGTIFHALSNCDLFCLDCLPQKPLSDWWKFFNSQSEASFEMLLKAS